MRTIFLTLGLFLLALGSINAAEKPVATQYGDWSKVCEKDPTGKDFCYIVQRRNNKEGTAIMELRIGHAPKIAEPILIVTLPLGALLPEGVRFVTDVKDAPGVKIPFLTCLKEGCRTIGQPLPAELVKAMKKGTKAEIQITLQNGKTLPLAVSLKGITAAFKSITK